MNIVPESSPDLVTSIGHNMALPPPTGPIVYSETTATPPPPPPLPPSEDADASLNASNTLTQEEEAAKAMEEASIEDEDEDKTPTKKVKGKGKNWCANPKICPRKQIPEGYPMIREGTRPGVAGTGPWRKARQEDGEVGLHLNYERFNATTGPFPPSHCGCVPPPTPPASSSGAGRNHVNQFRISTVVQT